ncbi:MAG: glutamate formimidoyltransferase [Chloroflexota bacterium]
MPVKLVECIPNFSEARQQSVIDVIVEEIRSVGGVRILDQHSDMDHNRTVITYIGPPEAVEEAAYLAIAKASQLINLDNHKGEHPRIGATDVVPFVPISGVTMVECVEMARRLGKRVGELLKIPVYLYEEAATRPERANLENIRRGQYETLKDVIATDPDREPDYGPKVLTGAGATVIGARQPLIAFNVYLTSDDVSIANKIARRVRNSSGGFHFVKAMGVLVDGRAQVSMNLTNYKKTPMAQVVEMIRLEAQRYGTAIHHSEIVGLLPNNALIDAAQWYMQMDQFENQQILETRLYEDLNTVESPESIKESSFLDELASGAPAPGGGSAAAHSAAVAAALVAMVGRLTVGKVKYAGVEEEMWQLIEQAEELRKLMLEAVKKDADVFEAFMRAKRLPKETEEQKANRIQAISAASINAAAIPLEVAHNSLKILGMALQMAKKANLNAITDAGTSGAIAHAALKGAALNVRVNLLGLEKEVDPARMLSELKQCEGQADKIMQQLQQVLTERGGLNS